MRVYAMWASVLVWASLPTAHALMIKEEPQVDTELYMAPASYTRKDGKALPSTIIISKPLGIRTSPAKNTESPVVFSIASEEEDDDDSRDGSLGLQPNIKFYKIECTSGRSCTSIIPSRSISHDRITAMDRTTARPFTDEDIKNYLKQFSLKNGFPYTDDYESSGTPKSPEESEESRHLVETDDTLDHETQRAFGTTHFNRPGFWPGSAHRPRPSKGQVFKYEQYFPSEINHPAGVSAPERRPPFNWDKISESFPPRNPTKEWQNARPLGHRPSDKHSRPQHYQPSQLSRPHQSSRPYPEYDSNDQSDHFPFDSPEFSSVTTVRPAPYEGVWKRYSTSTISQHDKDTGEWVKISTSNTDLDQGVFKRPSNIPDKLSETTHQAKASLTVLGLSERRPHSAFSARLPHGTRVMEVPSALPGRPPALIETDGSNVAKTEGLPGTSPRDTTSSSSVSFTSVSPTGLAQSSTPFRVRGKFIMQQ
ncbi:uncharacterized protein [Procambarus clarkii]|uniref:uncharacterized protein isoform X2 n=1 Tax=Procambarus clarkii TaxID=6728 RepID=UPI001E671A59|nr:uncharacterized protein LOC123771866 [Procambarus clarkii]